MAKEKKLPVGISRYRGAYRVRITYEGRQYHVGEYHNLTLAKEALNVAWSQKIQGTFIPPLERRKLIKAAQEEERKKNFTVNQWADIWLEALETDKKHPRTPGTLATYRSALRVHILPQIGHLNLTDVTPQDIENLMDSVREKTGGNGANIARTLRSLFNTAIARNAGALRESPVELEIKKSKRKRNERQRDATPAEVAALADAMPPRLRIAVLLAGWLGLRQGEILGLQRKHLHELDTPENAWLEVEHQWLSQAKPPRYGPTKTEESQREMSIPASFVPVIKNHLAEFVPAGFETPLIPSTQNPRKPVSQTTLDREWRKAREGIKPQMRFHDLRSVALTNYAQLGATLKDLMELAGHSDHNVAMVYQESAKRRQRQLADKLDTVMTSTDNSK